MRRLIGLAALVLVVAIVASAQLLLPAVARDRVRSELKGYGQIQNVEVAAFPAIELIWHHADTLSLKMASFHADSDYLEKLVNQSAEVGSARISATEVRVGLLTLRRAKLIKTGDLLTATGEVRESDITAAIGGLIQNVVPVTSPDDQLMLRGTAPIVGPIEALVTPHDGQLTIAPQLGLLGSPFKITLFDDPQIAIESVSASANTSGFDVTLRARLR